MTPSPDFPPKKCSRCSVARYCNVDCQRSDWRKIHRQACKQYCDNREAGFCMIECLHGSDWIDDEIFDVAMDRRKEAFLDALVAKQEHVNLTMQAAVVPRWGKLRLAVAVNFMDVHLEKMIVVNHVIYNVVDDKGSAEALDLINRNSGDVSAETLEKVHQLVEEFCSECKELDFSVNNITLGRGLVHKDKEFQERLRHISESILMMPSMDYVMSDMMSNTMDAFLKTGK